jgi:hypothetical protein
MAPPIVKRFRPQNRNYLNTKVNPNGKGSSGSPYNNVLSVNTHTAFSSGDTILIACGCTVTNTNLQPPATMNSAKGCRGVLNPQGSGTLGKPPILIDTFIDNSLGDLNYHSTVKPVIDAQGQIFTAGILLYNQQYWTIKDLEIKNQVHFSSAATLSDSFTAQGYRWGILVDFDNYTSTPTYNNISIINNTVDSVYGSYCYAATGQNSGTWWDWWGNTTPSMHFVGGIMVISDGTTDNSVNGNPLMNSILIAGDSVREIAGEGILVFALGGDLDFGRNWNNLVPGVKVHKNLVQHTAGDGIFVNGSNNELIDSNYVFGVGSLGKPSTTDSTGTWAEVGIFVMQHKNGIIEYNQVDSTYRPHGDAQAIDNDGCLSGTTLIQYNYTQNNAGGFFQDDFTTYQIGSVVFSRDDSAQPDSSIIRYNVSQNDGFDDNASTSILHSHPIG